MTDSLKADLEIRRDPHAAGFFNEVFGAAHKIQRCCALSVASGMERVGRQMLTPLASPFMAAFSPVCSYLNVPISLLFSFLHTWATK